MEEAMRERYADPSTPPGRSGDSEDKMRVVESQPSATHVSLHQRSLTPVFVDTQLSSTTMPATPRGGHTLTLHEYRKKQQIPSPPLAGPVKRVKRKPATPDLSTTGRVKTRLPLSPSVASNHSLELSPSPWPSENIHGPPTRGFDAFAALNSSDSVPSFTSLLESYYDRSNSAPPLTSNLSDPSKSVYSGDTFVTPEKTRARHFKPSKRLPRPVTQRGPRFSHSSITPSPLRLANSKLTSHLTSQPRETNHSSSFAISKFSFPEPPSPPAASLPRGHTESAATTNTQRSSADQQEAKTPTTLHFRGVSFDVVNPHNSLNLHNIETPADRDADISDYFETRSEPADIFRNHKRNNPSNRTMESRQTFLTANENNSPNSGHESRRLMTPPRAVYNDLTAAHHAITSRNGFPTSERSSRLELPLPPPPVAISPHKSVKTQLSVSSSNLSSYRPEPLNVQKASTSPSVLRRVTSIFRRSKPVEDEESKGSSSGTQSIALLDQQPTSTPRRAPSIHLQWFQKLGHDKRTSRSAPYFSGTSHHSARGPGNFQRQSVSQPEIRHSAYVSNYAGTEAAESRIFDTESIPPDWSSPDLDYSQEVHDQSNLWQFADKSDAETQRLSLLREGASDSILNRYTPNDTTLDSIVGQYYNDAPPTSAPSLTTISTAGEEQDTSPAIERGRHGANARLANFPSSGLSQFDFELSRSDTGSDFSDDEPQETPSRMSGVRSLRTSAGGPPPELLPSLPDSDLRPPEPPFMHRGHLNTIESGTSYASSYGDTRNLLLISSSTQPQGNATPESRLGSLLPSEGAKASSTTLPATFYEKDEHRTEQTMGVETAVASQNPPEIGTRQCDRQISLEQVMSDKVKHNGHLSGISTLSGSLFVLKNANRQHSSPCQSPADHSSVLPDTPKGLMEGIPKMWQEPSPASLSYQSDSKERTNHKQSLSGGTGASDDPDEWETVGDASRGDVGHEETEDSYASITRSADDSDIDHDRDWVPYVSPRQKNPKMFTNTSLSTIPSSTRENPDRMSSSTAPSMGMGSNRANSFTKFTITGPKLNLTGTPRGTGMREVGSSEADNSSPGMRFSSSPWSPKSFRSFHQAEDRQPELSEYGERDDMTPDSSPPDSAGLPGISAAKSYQSHISGTRMLVSPQESTPRRHHFPADSLSSSLRSSSEIPDGNRANEGCQRRYEHLRAPSKKWAPLYSNYQAPSVDEHLSTHPRRKGSRRSVHGQKELMPMKLAIIPQSRAEREGTNEDAIRRPEPAEISKFTSHRRQSSEIRPATAAAVSIIGSTKTEAPLLMRPSHPGIVRDRPSTTDSPSLKPIPPTPSLLAARRPREKLFSRIVFALCTLFPPALIMYGFGYMDSLIAAATRGEYLAFGTQEKRFARYVGITMTVAIVVAITAFMVSIAVKWS
ncbi:hypothetical protein EV356DRAFT_189587 [Viridothelium virens]|uniref:Uncharacterized protein n=1 Tax=Viridothelium virens TaxID=1048519 RepID=A0A6A6H8M5_VIRVR|nr:hypothetical protein EV356DRAFT_189587 [Viridothelium virens]